MDSDSSNGAEKSKLKTFWKEFIIIDTAKNSCDAWEEVKILTLTGVLKKLISTLMDDLERFKTLVEEVTEDEVEIARELESGVDPEESHELLQSHDKT